MPRKRRRRRKKKKYHRHPKPPYTYLAMIALVIQASPDRKLKLSQIIKEISTLFPFFKDGYQGWKDSIRHNLSANDCFHKVLKDPAKPKAKGNFWTVDVDLIPPEALKLQNTPVSRQEERAFTVDLAPFVYHGWAFNTPPPPLDAAAPGGSGAPGSDGGRQSSPFSIDALLHDFQDVAGLGAWGTVPIFRVSSGGPVLPWRPPCPLPVLSSLSSSSRSLSPNEREEPKEGGSSLTSAKRPRVICPTHESSGSDSREGTPPPAAPCWEELPTSYTPCVAPNVVVAPPSPTLPFSAFPANPAFPSYSPTPLAHPACWELMPRPSLSPITSSRACLDPDEAMPPNKTVFDVWMSHPMDIVHPAFPRTGHSPRSSVLAHYNSS
ncbi:forkhead box protein H1-like [Candoia aspera]|uniref:forkhead box protein H1-like n=1 Tax=Candoia aspera TaxID=51853 RepID=UPI002FD8251F